MPVKLCQKMFSSAITTGDNVATVIVPQPLTLILCSWIAWGTNAGAVGTSAVFQLTTMSTSSFVSNDVRGIIDEFLVFGDKAINFNFGGTKITPIPGIKFAAGDVIRLHRSIGTAPTSLACSLNLQFV